MSDSNGIQLETFSGVEDQGASKEEMTKEQIDAYNRTANGKREPMEVPPTDDAAPTPTDADAVQEPAVAPTTDRQPAKTDDLKPLPKKAPVTKEEPPTTTTKDEQTTKAEEVVPLDQFWSDKITNEVAESGEISEDSLTTLKEKYNIPESMAKNYIELQKAKDELTTYKIASEFATKDEYNNIRDWAADNLSDGEFDIVNNMISSNNYKDVADFLKYKHSKSGGSLGIVRGQADKTNQTLTGFKSMREQINAQRDPRYAKDPAYRQMVEKRIEMGSY